MLGQVYGAQRRPETNLVREALEVRVEQAIRRRVRKKNSWVGQMGKLGESVGLLWSPSIWEEPQAPEGMGVLLPSTRSAFLFTWGLTPMFSGLRAPVHQEKPALLAQRYGSWCPQATPAQATNKGGAQTDRQTVIQNNKKKSKIQKKNNRYGADKTKKNK